MSKARVEGGGTLGDFFWACLAVQGGVGSRWAQAGCPPPSRFAELRAAAPPNEIFGGRLGWRGVAEVLTVAEGTLGHVLPCKDCENVDGCGMWGICTD